MLIHSLCLLCAGLYAVNIAMLVVTWNAVRSTGEGLRGSLRRELEYWGDHQRQVAAWFAASAVVASIIGFAYSVETLAGSRICEAVAKAATQGDRSYPVTMVVYSDFQCPHCKAVDRSLRPLRDSPRLRIEFRHYPLDAACNPRVQHSRHPGACLQARAAICADAQGRAEVFRDRLFEEGAKDFEGLLRLSAALGLDRDQLQSCLESDESARKLDESVKEAIAANVRATPTLFVNGARHVGRLSDEDLSCLNRLR